MRVDAMRAPAVFVAAALFIFVGCARDDSGDTPWAELALASTTPVLTVPGQKLAPSGTASSSSFGASAAISNITAVIGAHEASRVGGGGAAFVYVLSGTKWTADTKLTAVGGGAGDAFGASVDVRAGVIGGSVIVGAPSADASPPSPKTNIGAAYVYTKIGSTWSQRARLTAHDATDGDKHGTAVAFGSSWVVVGAPFDDDKGADSGSAYIYASKAGTWPLEQKLTAADGGAGHELGTAVSGSTFHVVIGAPDADGKVAGAGAAYVFGRSGTTWTQRAKLTAPDGSAGDGFGRAVALEGNIAVVGAATNGSGRGAAYIFDRSSGTAWTFQQKIIAADGRSGDAFGASVDVNLATVIVGAPARDVSGKTDAGSAYVFVRSGTTWSQRQKITAVDGAAGDRFGDATAVGALSHEVAIVGAHGDDVTGTNSGSAYAYLSTLADPRPDISIKSFAMKTDGSTTVIIEGEVCTTRAATFDMKLWVSRATVPACNAPAADAELKGIAFAFAKCERFSLPVPGFAVGSYTAQLQVDGACAVAEPNEGNNTATSRYIVGQDASVRSFAATVSGGTVRISGELCYAGTSASTFDVSLWLDHPSTPTCATTGADASAPIVMLANTCESFDTGPLIFPRGSYATRILLDSGCRLAEGSEANNAAVATWVLP